MVPQKILVLSLIQWTNEWWRVITSGIQFLLGLQYVTDVYTPTGGRTIATDNRDNRGLGKW